MRLHTNTLTTTQLYTTLNRAENAGLIASSVYFEILEDKGSRSRDHAFEIQLGSTEKVKGDKRGYKNSGHDGASTVWAATYAEWGYFITGLFELDPEATFGPYKGREDFRRQTTFNFAATVPTPDPFPYVMAGHNPRGIRFAIAPRYLDVEYAPRISINA